MKGAIIGDIVGSVYEYNPIKTTDFKIFDDRNWFLKWFDPKDVKMRFSDDSVLTIAVMYAILQNISYEKSFRDIGQKYPEAGYGLNFFKWLYTKTPQPYNSYGNGSAMRVSPIGLAFDNIEDVLDQAYKSAVMTHNHLEGIKGAQSVAIAVFMAKNSYTKEQIKHKIIELFDYDLDRTLEKIRPDYKLDATSQGSVPEAIIAFLESSNYESAIKNAISLGGDADTQACIAGAIAEAYYKYIPQELIELMDKKLDNRLRTIVYQFYDKFAL